MEAVCTRHLPLWLGYTPGNWYTPHANAQKLFKQLILTCAGVLIFLAAVLVCIPDSAYAIMIMFS